jgi:hypothetical protein
MFFWVLISSLVKSNPNLRVKVYFHIFFSYFFTPFHFLLNEMIFLALGCTGSRIPMYGLVLRWWSEFLYKSFDSMKTYPICQKMSSQLQNSVIDIITIWILWSFLSFHCMSFCKNMNTIHAHLVELYHCDFCERMLDKWRTLWPGVEVRLFFFNLSPDIAHLWRICFCFLFPSIYFR